MVRGAIVNHTTDNPFNGVFAIEALGSELEPDDPTKLRYKLGSNPGATPTGDIKIGGGVSSHYLLIDPAKEGDEEPHPRGPGIKLREVINEKGETEYRVTVRTLVPHQRTTNNNVVVISLYLPDGTLSGVYNGTFPIVHYDPAFPDELEYNLKQPPDAQPEDLYRPYGRVGAAHIGLDLDGGTAAVAEGNQVYHITVAGPITIPGAAKT